MPVSFASVMAAKSPAAWWRLGESSGTTMTDSSGNGRNGVYNGSPWTPPTLGATGLLHDGDTNTAASFNGTTSECEVTYNSSWMNDTTFSAFARIKPNTTTGNHSVIGRYVGVSTFVNAWVIRQDGSTVYLWYHNGSNYFSLTLGTVAANTEYSVGVAVGSGAIKVYFNGSLAATATDVVRGTTANLIIGANYQGSPNELFSGVIDEVAYWNATLTSTDMADLHTAATTTPNTGSAALALTASGGAAATSGGSASLSLTASGGTSAAAAGSASLSLTAAGALTPPTPAAGAAALALTASGGASGSPGGTASLNLTATGTAIAVLAASGSATLTLTASGSAVMSAGGTATLTLSAGGVAFALYRTDLSNAMNGRGRHARATATVDRPAAALPPGRTFGLRYDKAIAYDRPTMVEGRPT